MYNAFAFIIDSENQLGSYGKFKEMSLEKTGRWNQEQKTSLVAATILFFFIILWEIYLKAAQSCTMCTYYYMNLYKYTMTIDSQCSSSLIS
jgi:hypothetical protein